MAMCWPEETDAAQNRVAQQQTGWNSSVGTHTHTHCMCFFCQVNRGVYTCICCFAHLTRKRGNYISKINIRCAWWLITTFLSTVTLLLQPLRVKQASTRWCELMNRRSNPVKTLTYNNNYNRFCTSYWNYKYKATLPDWLEGRRPCQQLLLLVSHHFWLKV